MGDEEQSAAGKGEGVHLMTAVVHVDGKGMPTYSNRMTHSYPGASAEGAKRAVSAVLGADAQLAGAGRDVGGHHVHRGADAVAGEVVLRKPDIREAQLLRPTADLRHPLLSDVRGAAHRGQPASNRPPPAEGTRPRCW